MSATPNKYADRHVQYMNVGRPCHRGWWITIKCEIQRCELAQGRYSGADGIVWEGSPVPSVFANSREAVIAATIMLPVLSWWQPLFVVASTNLSVRPMATCTV